MNTLNGARLLQPRAENEIGSVTLTLNQDGTIGIDGTLASNPLLLNMVLDKTKAHLVANTRPMLAPNGTN